MNIRTLATAALVALSLTACQSATMGTKQTLGTIGGGVAGAAIGSQFGKGQGQLIAVGAGTLLGAFIGNEVGASLDKADALHAEQAAQRAFEYTPSGKTTRWQNPDSGNSGWVRPVGEPEWRSPERPCRQYETAVVIDGRTEKARGTACRNADGTWQIQ